MRQDSQEGIVDLMGVPERELGKRGILLIFVQLRIELKLLFRQFAFLFETGLAPAALDCVQTRCGRLDLLPVALCGVQFSGVDLPREQMR